MMKYYLSLSVSVLILFSACSTKSALNHFENDPKSAKAIQYTKKTDLIYKNEINSMFFATYQNNINKEYKSEKLNSFVVGIHLVNKNEHDFIKNNYTITLDDKKPLSITKIDKKSKLVSTIPLKNNWANYYLIQFENNETQNMKMNFTHPIFGKTQISFQK